jgi:hypothetical protein
MTKFVVEINLIVRNIVEASNKDEAEKLAWSHENRWFDESDVMESTTSAMTKEEYDKQHDSSLIRDLDLPFEEYVEALKAHYGWWK